MARDASGNQRTSTYQVSTTGSTTTYTHDANGNLTGDGTKTYEWDAENRLVRVCTGACAGNGSTDIARFAYDGLGRRVRKIVGATTLEYVYDGAEIAEERSSSGTNLRFVHGPGIDQHWAQYVSTSPSSPTYLLADHLGSIVQQTNTAGAVTFTRHYDPWGNLLVGASAGRYAYTGREWDPETGLYYYRARYYDSKAGRFASEDPASLELPLYSYASNRPVLEADPMGLWSTARYPLPVCIPWLFLGHLSFSKAWMDAQRIYPNIGDWTRDRERHCYAACVAKRMSPCDASPEIIMLGREVVAQLGGTAPEWDDIRAHYWGAASAFTHPSQTCEERCNACPYNRPRPW